MDAGGRAKDRTVAVGLAALLMLGCRAMHPPAGIDAFLVAGLGLPTNWIVNPVAAGAIPLAGYSRAWAQGEHRLSRLAGHGSGLPVGRRAA